MKTKLLSAALLVYASTAFAQTDSIVSQRDSTEYEKKSEGSVPFAWGDFTWLQGGERMKKQALDSKYFTGDVTLDVDYNYHFADPIDHTQTGSTASFRTNELALTYVEAGGDFHDPATGARGRLMLQFGTRAVGVPRNDNTGLRGQFDLYNSLRYVTEGYAGIHLKKMHGINIDAGIFKSYVGLMSYNPHENWNYQNSFTSDNTPWFFTGVRIQTFPTEKLKIEYWIVNGWQTYGMYNNQPGLGFQVDWRPKEWIKFLGSGYVGYDTPNMPGRTRFHSDNSILVRYFKRPGKFFSKGAFSVTGDIGFESGNGVAPFKEDLKYDSTGAIDPATSIRAQNFLSWMFYHRLWLGKNEKWAWTFGGGQLSNPGRYLSLVPPGAGAQSVGAGSAYFTQNAGDPLENWDYSTGVQWMPNEKVTIGLEYVERHSNIGYFPGHGGVTSPNGWNAPIGNPTGFVPDLAKMEQRIIASFIVRF
ncbi:MAG: outer membrane beta-barrel protein [Bacteroidota bacterium]|nr:outer membrane beta-barrel protein [Bacteroidota bacterium]